MMSVNNIKNHKKLKRNQLNRNKNLKAILISIFHIKNINLVIKVLFGINLNQLNFNLKLQDKNLPSKIITSLI